MKSRVSAAGGESGDGSSPMLTYLVPVVALAAAVVWKLYFS